MTHVLKRACLVAGLALLAAGPAQSGQVAGVRCWVNGELVGGFAAGYSCPPGAGSGAGVVIGPSAIVWRHPGAADSQMPSPAQSPPASQADASLTHVRKGEYAMKQGDLAAAKQYFDAAARHDPHNPRILDDIALLQVLADASGPAPEGQSDRMQNEVLAPLPSSLVDRFAGYGAIRSLRAAELAAYRRVAEADAARSAVIADLARGAATQQDVDAARMRLDAAAQDFKSAQSKLRYELTLLGR